MRGDLISRLLHFEIGTLNAGYRAPALISVLGAINGPAVKCLNPLGHLTPPGLCAAQQFVPAFNDDKQLIKARRLER
jgi:hypothetical protein